MNKKLYDLLESKYLKNEAKKEFRETKKEKIKTKN